MKYNYRVSNKIITGSILFLSLILFISTFRNELSPQAAEPTTLGASSQTEEVEKEQVIILENDRFKPAHITIKVGTKVTWINQSGEVADVDSGPHPAHDNYPPLNFGIIEDGESRSLFFNNPGIYGYHNHLKSQQEGTVTVRE